MPSRTRWTSPSLGKAFLLTIAIVIGTIIATSFLAQDHSKPVEIAYGIKRTNQ